MLGFTRKEIGRLLQHSSPTTLGRLGLRFLGAILSRVRAALVAIVPAGAARHSAFDFLLLSVLLKFIPDFSFVVNQRSRYLIFTLTEGFV